MGNATFLKLMEDELKHEAVIASTAHIAGLKEALEIWETVRDNDVGHAIRARISELESK